MPKTAKKALSLLMSAAIFISLFSAFPKKASAASPSGVYGGIASTVLLSAIDDLEDDFELEETGWRSDIGDCQSIIFTQNKPHSPYEGERALLCEAGSLRSGDGVTVKRTANVITDASVYKYVAAAIYVPYESGGASATLKLNFAKGSISDTKKLDAGKWQTVFFEIKSGSKGRITDIELTLSPSSDCEFYFLLDTVGGCRSASDMNASRYLSAELIPSGCSLEYGKNLTVTLDGPDQYIEGVSPIISSVPEGTALRLELINNSSCRSVTFKYKSAGSEEYDRETVSDIPSGAGEVSIVLPIEDGYLGPFMLSFSGSPTGDLEIVSLSVSPCLESYRGLGSIDECRIARDKKSIIVQGGISADSLSALTEDSVLLFALSPYESVLDIASKKPIGEGRADGGRFSFTVPLDESRDGVFKKYCAAVYTEEGLVSVSEGAYVVNPEILASERTSLPESIKGIRPLGDNYVLDGISQTAVDIDAEKLFTITGDSGITHTVGGRTYLFSKEYISYLDETVKEYSREGIKLRFVLRVSKTDELTVSSLLCHPDSGGGYSAFNTESDSGIYALRALTDLLVTRYGSSDGVSDSLVGIVLGTSANDAYKNYNMGEATLTSFVRAYSSALRIVYNTALSVTSGFEVAIALGGGWCEDATPSARGSFDARTVLEALSEQITSEGDIDWQLSYDITPERGSYAWEETSPDLGHGADRITAANLEVLTGWLSRAPFTYNGASRSLLFLGGETRLAESEDERRALSCDYIYTYLRVASRSLKNAAGYIPAHTADYCDAVRYVETNMFRDKTAFAAELIGSERYLALIAASTGGGRTYYEGTSLEAYPDGIKGENVIFDFSKKGSAAPSLKCHATEGGVGYGGRSDWLRVRLGEAELGSLRGFTASSSYPLDLSEAPYLSFNVRTSSIPEGVESVDLTVVLFSKNSSAVTKLSVPTHGESRVVCDLSGFSHLSSCERIGIYVSSEDSDIGEPMLLVSSVKALSKTLSGSELEGAIHVNSENSDTVSVYTVIALGITAASALIILALRIFLKKKASDKLSEDDE